MKNVLLMGISSGIGNTLTRLLIKKDFKVWGVARRKNLLNQLDKELRSKNFYYTIYDITENSFWNHLIRMLHKKKFIPDIIIFNAALNENDLSNSIDLDKLRRIMEVNFFSVLKGVKLITENYNNKLHFIVISSTSAFKGNYKEGIGYAASKGAISIAFESLFQKYFNSKIKFTTIFLGPVKTNMIRFAKAPPFTLTTDQVAEYILKAINQKKSFYYYPRIIFVFLRIMRLFPNHFFYKVWTIMQRPYIHD